MTHRPHTARHPRRRFAGAILAGILALSLTAPASLAQTLITSATYGQQVEDLSSGDVLEAIHASRGEELNFRLYVPADAATLDIRTTGGNGDMDLYVRHGQLPGKAAFDARSTGRTAVEQVVIRQPREGWWYITLRAFTDVSGVEMLVRHDGRNAIQNGGAVDDMLRDGERVTRLQGGAGETISFRINVPQAANRLTLAMDGGSGDADLYLAHGYQPTPKRYDARSVGKTNAERLSIDRPAAGTWYITIYAYGGFAGAALQASVADGYLDSDPYAPAGLQLTRPNDHTVWLLGGTELVTWRAADYVRDVQIQFSLDGGRTWRRDGLPERIDAGLGEYFIKLPESTHWKTDRARIRIVDPDGRRLYDTSETFRIVANRDEDRHNGDLYENDNHPRLPSRILLGEAQQRTIHPEDDQDYVIFVPTAAGRYVATFDRLSVDLEADVIHVDTAGRQRKLDDLDIDDDGADVLFTAGGDTRAILFRIRAEDDDETGRYVMLIRKYVTQPQLPLPLPPNRWPAPRDRRDDRRDDRNDRRDRHDGRDDRIRNNTPSGATILRGDASKVENLSGREGNTQKFRVQVPNGTKQLSVHTEDGDGRIDLYVERNRDAGRNATWKSRGGGTEQTVNIRNPQAGWYYITILGRENYRGVEIAAYVQR